MAISLGLDQDIEQRLACPRCHSALTSSSGLIECTGPSCGFKGEVRDGVVVIEDLAGISYFDETLGLVKDGVLVGSSVREMCYARQASCAEEYLRPGTTVLDVGCGPILPYKPRVDCYLIGMDLSFESVRQNTRPDMRLYASATALPLPDSSIDTILCLYSVHHMTGSTRELTHQNVRRAFGEFARTIRPGGDLLIFEISPWRPMWRIETALWNIARRVIGSGLDMYFWSRDTLCELGDQLFQADLRAVEFKSPLLSVFPPIFSKPWFKIPRFLYPFDVNLYHWKF